MAKKKKPKQKPRGERPPPKCKAILLCDAVIIDALTGKASVIGIFEGFYLRALPGRTVAAKAFLQLVDGHGKYDLIIEIHDLKRDAIIAKGTGLGVEFEDKLQRKNVLIPIPPMPIQHEGVYDLVVKAGRAEIDRQQFAVKVILPPTTPEESNEKQNDQ